MYYKLVMYSHDFETNCDTCKTLPIKLLLSCLLCKKHLQLLFTIRMLRTAAHKNSVQQVCNYSKSNIKSCGSMASSFCTSHKNMTCQRHAQTTPLCAKEYKYSQAQSRGYGSVHHLFLYHLHLQTHYQNPVVELILAIHSFKCIS